MAENILFSCWTDSASPFIGPVLCDASASISRLSVNGTLEAGIALALLVHASKCRGRVSFLKFHSLAICSPRLNITEPVSQNTVQFAEAYLRKEPLKSILLSNKTGMEDFLPKIRTVFVDLDDTHIRGWCAPRMVIINRKATRGTLLEEPVPFLGLCGHETRHVVVRESNDNDLNFLTPEKPELISAISKLHRESGLWFEITAIGEKYDFIGKADPAHAFQMTELIAAIHHGITEGCLPALSVEQRKRFYNLGAPYNSEMPFDCEDQCPCYFTE